MSHGEWDPRALTPEMKELIDEILYGVAIGSNHHAIRAIQKVFAVSYTHLTLPTTPYV